MSVSTVEVKERYAGRGDTGPYALTCEVLLDAGGNAQYSKVALRNALGQESDITSECSVSGKNIYTTTAYGSEYTIVVYREVPYTQPASFPLGGSTTPKNFEQSLDRAILQIQQLSEQVSRAVKAAISEEASELTLPPKELRPNSYLHFDEDGHIEVQPGPPPRYWDPAYTYRIPGRLILYNGKLWKFVAGSDTGTEPGNDSTVWEQYPLGGVCNDSWTFALNDTCSYGGIIYKSLQAGNQNHQPDSSPLWWEEAAAMSNADQVDGKHASDLADVVHTHPGSDVTSQVGDADTVDGEHASAFADAVHTHGGGELTSVLTKMCYVGPSSNYDIDAGIGMPIDVVYRNVGGAFNVIAANRSVEIVEDGAYLLHYHITTEINNTSSDRSDSYARLEKSTDGGSSWSAIDPTFGGMYNRTNGYDLSNAAALHYEHLNAGDRIRLFATKNSGGASIAMRWNSTAMMMMKI